MSTYRIVTQFDTSDVRRGRREVQSELGKVESAADSVKSSLRRAFAGAAIGGALTAAAKEAAGFESAIAEVSTLVDTASFDMDGLTESTKEQAKAFGSLPQAQAKAAYQIISAGATSAAEAQEILDASNRLAVGGMTDVTVAADGLTSVLNAYGPAAGKASDVSDTLFVGMRAGKTTIEELSSGLGKVAPLAAQTGVSFDELVASVSALTKGGIATREAITGVRAILAAVSKPTSEAKKAAAALGLEFNTASLEANGFAGFMDDVIEKTGGSTDSLAVLFGGVEAIIPAMALAGQAGQDMNNILGDMEGKAGATGDAFDKVASTSAFKFAQLMSQIRVLMIDVGGSALGVLVPAMALVSNNFDLIVTVGGAAVSAFVAYRSTLLLASAANVIFTGSSGIMLGAIASTTRAFGVAAGANVALTGAVAGTAKAFSLLRAAMLSNPVTAIAVGIASLAAAMFFLKDGTNDAADAAIKKAQADQAAAEAENKRIQLVQKLTQATAQQREEMIAAARASIQKAQSSVAAARADVTAAKAALDRAIAERELAAAISSKPGQGYSPIGAPGLGRVVRSSVAESEARDILSARRDAAEKAEAALENRRLDLKALRDSLKVSGGGGGSVPSLANLADGGALGSAANDNSPTTTFQDIAKGLIRTRDLMRKVGIERDVMRAQLQAEDELKRKLTATERARIDSLVREADTIDRTNEFMSQHLGALDDEIEIMRRLGIEQDIYSEQLRAAETLGRDLTEQEKRMITERIESLQLLKDMNDAYDGIRDPIEQHERQLAAINELLAQGVISQREYNLAMQEMQLNQNLNGVLSGLGGTFGQEAEQSQIELDAARDLEILRQAHEAKLIERSRYAKLEYAIEQRRLARLEELRRADRELAVKSAGSAFGELATLTKEAVGEQSAAYKALFAIHKAFAIAESIINIQRAIASALASGATLGEKIAAVATVVANAASIVSTIRSVSLAFAQGGYVSGPGGPTSDSILARLSNGEFVMNAAATRQYRPMLEQMNSGRPPANDNFGRGGIGGRSISFGDFHFHFQGSGDPEDDGRRAGEEFKRTVRGLVREEISEQSRSGGALTATKKSALVG